MKPFSVALMPAEAREACSAWAERNHSVRESLVLLKNVGGLLPLWRKTRVLVAGDGLRD